MARAIFTLAASSRKYASSGMRERNNMITIDKTDYFTASEVAVKTGLAHATVRAYGAKYKIGRRIFPGARANRLYSEKDIDFLKNLPDGRKTRWHKN
jgi:hypothetical protein